MMGSEFELRALSAALKMTGQDHSDVLLLAASRMSRMRFALEAIAKHRLHKHKTQAALLAEDALRDEPTDSATEKHG